MRTKPSLLNDKLTLTQSSEDDQHNNVRQEGFATQRKNEKIFLDCAQFRPSQERERERERLEQNKLSIF